MTTCSTNLRTTAAADRARFAREALVRAAALHRAGQLREQAIDEVWSRAVLALRRVWPDRARSGRRTRALEG